MIRGFTLEGQLITLMLPLIYQRVQVLVIILARYSIIISCMTKYGLLNHLNSESVYLATCGIKIGITDTWKLLAIYTTCAVRYRELTP